MTDPGNNHRHQKPPNLDDETLDAMLQRTATPVPPESPKLRGSILEEFDLRFAEQTRSAENLAPDSTTVRTPRVLTPRVRTLRRWAAAAAILVTGLLAWRLPNLRDPENAKAPLESSERESTERTGLDLRDQEIPFSRIETARANLNEFISELASNLAQHLCNVLEPIDLSDGAVADSLRNDVELTTDSNRFDKIDGFDKIDEINEIDEIDEIDAMVDRFHSLSTTVLDRDEKVAILRLALLDQTSRQTVPRSTLEKRYSELATCYISTPVGRKARSQLATLRKEN